MYFTWISFMKQSSSQVFLSDVNFTLNILYESIAFFLTFQQ